MPTSPFNPDPATTDAILQSIAADYSLSLTDIAAQHNTTIEALTAWLTREDIDERLTAIESACARRARLTAANHLPAVAHVAKQALEEASDVLRLPPDYRTQRSIALRIRATESARRAAALLLRIANFTPGPRRVRHNAAPTSPRATPPAAPISESPAESVHPARMSAPAADRNPPAPKTVWISAPASEPSAAKQAPMLALAPLAESSPSAPLSAPISAPLSPNPLHVPPGTTFLASNRPVPATVTRQQCPQRELRRCHHRVRKRRGDRLRKTPRHARPRGERTVRQPHTRRGSGPRSQATRSYRIISARTSSPFRSLSIGVA